MEHKLITGGEQYLPFARSRIKAMRAAGLQNASQSFIVDGTTIRVRVSPGHEHIAIDGTGGGWVAWGPDLPLGESTAQFRHVVQAPPYTPEDEPTPLEVPEIPDQVSDDTYYGYLEKFDRVGPPITNWRLYRMGPVPLSRFIINPGPVGVIKGASGNTLTASIASDVSLEALALGDEVIITVTLNEAITPTEAETFQSHFQAYSLILKVPASGWTEQVVPGTPDTYEYSQTYIRSGRRVLDVHLLPFYSSFSLPYMRDSTQYTNAPLGSWANNSDSRRLDTTLTYTSRMVTMVAEGKGPITREEWTYVETVRTPWVKVHRYGPISGDKTFDITVVFVGTCVSTSVFRPVVPGYTISDPPLAVNGSVLDRFGHVTCPLPNRFNIPSPLTDDISGVTLVFDPPITHTLAEPDLYPNESVPDTAQAAAILAAAAIIAANAAAYDAWVAAMAVIDAAYLDALTAFVAGTVTPLRATERPRQIEVLNGELASGMNSKLLPPGANIRYIPRRQRAVPFFMTDTMSASTVDITDFSDPDAPTTRTQGYTVTTEGIDYVGAPLDWGVHGGERTIFTGAPDGAGALLTGTDDSYFGGDGSRVVDVVATKPEEYGAWRGVPRTVPGQDYLIAEELIAPGLKVTIVLLEYEMFDYGFTNAWIWATAGTTYLDPILIAAASGGPTTYQSTGTPALMPPISPRAVRIKGIIDHTCRSVDPRDRSLGVEWSPAKPSPTQEEASSFNETLGAMTLDAPLPTAIFILSGIPSEAMPGDPIEAGVVTRRSMTAGVTAAVPWASVTSVSQLRTNLTAEALRVTKTYRGPA